MQCALYRDALRYDCVTQALSGDGPITFYVAQLGRYGGPVLELACGTGRLAIPLAKAEAEVWGLDQSPEMLKLAEIKALRAVSPPITWVRGDMRRFDVGQRFQLIFIAGNSLSHLLSREDLEACFTSVRRHLAPEGRFIVDVFNPALGPLLRNPELRVPVCEYEDPDTGENVTVTKTTRYDSATQILYETWYFRRPPAGEEETVPLNLRMFFPQELDTLLHYNGFRLEHKYGDYLQTPFRSTASKQLIVCQRAG